VPEHFALAVTLHTELGVLATSDPVYKAKVAQATQHLEAAAHLFRQIGVFSPGEHFTEHSVASLRYLLIPAYRADVEGKVAGEVDDPERDMKRIRVIETSKTMLVEYLEGLVALGLEKEEAITRYVEMKPGDRLDRDVKVAIMRESMVAEKSLKTFAEQLAAAKKNGAVDEELEREHLLKTLKVWSLKAFSQIQMHLSEMGMLQQMMSHKSAAKADGRAGGAAATGGDDRRQQERPMEKPLVITKDMIKNMAHGQTINRADFQLINRGYGPIGAPTMSLDEFADLEMAKAIQASQPPPNAGALHEDGAHHNCHVDDCNDAADAETYKKREWDEWKDDVRRGDGNKMNRG